MGASGLLTLTGRMRVNKFQAVTNSEEEASPIGPSAAMLQGYLGNNEHHTGMTNSIESGLAIILYVSI